jgi:TonB-linked SusC/RagA family outer membrane protein
MKQLFTNFQRLKRRCCYVLLLISCLISSETFASKFANSIMITNVPPKVVTGTVNDQSGLPLPGANITVKGTNTIAIAGVDGKFAINVPEGHDILIISFMGFQTQEVNIASKKSIKVVLLEGGSTLNEVVIVGYGKQSRELMTTAVSKLDNAVLANVPYTNVASALQGTIPGIRVQTTSGMPGAAPRIVVRGGTSILNPNGATPLYIVDGVIRSNLSEIMADDIESIQVLKDAASTAIYGARGSNGVIIASTKSGKPGKFNINYSTSWSASEKNQIMEYASAKDYIYYSRLSIAATAIKTPGVLSRLTQAAAYGIGNDLTKTTAYTTQYLTPANQYKLNEGWESMPDPLDASKTIIFKDTKFQDLIYQTGISSKNYISASGGTDKTTFFAGFGYLSSQGIAIESDYKRFNLNLNGTVQATDKLGFYGRVLFGRNSQNTIANIANTFYRSASLPGSAKYMFEDGTMAPGQSNNLGNPDYYLKGKYALQGDNNYDNTTIAVGGKWDILPGLFFEPQFSMYSARSDSYDFQPTYLNGVLSTITSRVAHANYAKTTQYQGDGVLTYVKSLHSHNLEAKAGFSHYFVESYSQGSTGQGAATDLIPTLNASSTPTSVTGSKSIQVLEGFFSRINYDYEGKYLLSVNARYDGASNLGASYRYGFFPGVSAGWNMHKENFWKIFPANLLEFKIRTSYGVNGNISGLSAYTPQGSFVTSSIYGGSPAIQASIFPNPDLKWEQSKTFDVGFDAGLFNRRVNLTFDYYNRRTDDLLTTVPLPASSGFASVFTNNGSLQNKGLEAAIDVQLLPVKSNFKWSVSANAAYVKNKILKLPNNGVENNRQGGELLWDEKANAYIWKGGLQEGQAPGQLYNWRALGVYATDADAAKAPIDNTINLTNKTKYGGDVIYDDIDKNGILDARDKVYMGNIYPNWTGGFSNTFSYKSLSLVVRMDFTMGMTAFNYAKAFADGQLQGDALPSKDYIAKMWKKQGDITNTPRYMWQDQQGNITHNSNYFENADYLSLREVTLSYSLPASLLQKVKLHNVRLNLTGNNLHYFSKYTGTAIEEGTASDQGRYPNPRNFIFGANVTF